MKAFLLLKISIISLFLICLNINKLRFERKHKAPKDCTDQSIQRQSFYYDLCLVI